MQKPHSNAKFPILNSGKYVQISIQDHGKGIKKQDLARFFNPYFSSKEKGNIKGSELGLAIVDSIISRHNGHIGVKSEVETGTVFTFFLPASTEIGKKQKESSGDILFGKGTILIMDDESMILEMMKYSLPSIGYTAETADSGEPRQKQQTVVNRLLICR